VTVVANDPDDLKGTLKDIGGSRSDHWNNNRNAFKRGGYTAEADASRRVLAQQFGVKQFTGQ
jgi:hypothetical protein